jgi:hypothetical protein
VRVCWDLDNTLVRSGELIRTGTMLGEAIVQAEPVPNMLDFYAALAKSLSGADHFFLSARIGSMRADTLAWLERYGFELGDHALCLVPQADLKPRIWRLLGRGAKLVIVDDLSYDHERERPSVYHDLVAAAERTADVYIGLEQITAIAAEPAAVEPLAMRVANSLAAGPRTRSQT